jgi:hypothetical protein
MGRKFDVLAEQHLRFIGEQKNQLSIDGIPTRIVEKNR